MADLNEKVEALTAKLNADENFKKEIQELVAKKDMDGFLAKINSNGIDFSKDDLVALDKIPLSSGSESLSEDELEAVSGGVAAAAIAAGYGLFKAVCPNGPKAIVKEGIGFVSWLFN